MKLQRNIFKWIGMAFLFAVFMSFTFFLPLASAQEGDATATPSETPLPEVTPEPFEVPELEQEGGAQSLMSLQSVGELGGDWAAQVNISDTEEESFKPKIAADGSGNVHIVWRELVNGKQEIYYSWIDVDKTSQSLPFNVSNSPSFNSDSPQLVVDSTGVAHIVWQEEGNDHADDFETHYSNCQAIGGEDSGYSADCSTPAVLSDGDACGSFVGDWKSTDPSIGIDANDNLMVVWMSFEPNPRLYTMYSLWSASGSPPSNRTGCNLAAGSYYYPVVAGDSNGDFHLLRMNAGATIFYSKYSGGSWSANQTLGTGWLPVIHIESNNKIHAAWWNTNAPPKYRSKESTSSTWSGTEDVFSNTLCSDLSLITDVNNLPRLTCSAGAVYEASRQASGWTETVIIQSMASQPDLVKDSNNNLHLVWSDSRSGSWDIFYSPTYTCDGIEPATTAGQVVLSKIQGIPFLNYCKNLVEEIIYIPAPDGQNDPNEAFQEWADLASSAQYEVAFTVMFWNERADSPYPGEKVLQGIQQLFTDVKDPVNANKYPHGMKVRILLGIERNALRSPSIDQRFSVLDELKAQDIPVYELLPNGRDWKVEVALYYNGHGLSFIPPLSTGKYSHLKLMVVDNNKIIVSGYHPQYEFQTDENGNANAHDLGMKVSGPIAANGMAVFDSLWDGSEVLCTEEDDILQIEDWNLCNTSSGENPTHWFFAQDGDDVAFPLYRDADDKTADLAIEEAIKSSDEQVYIVQNRFVVQDPYNIPWVYDENDLLEYATALIDRAGDIETRILISRDLGNVSVNFPSAANFLIRYYLAGGQQLDAIRFYAPDGRLNSFPMLHTKSFMIDGEFLVIGSQNFDNSAFGNSHWDLDLVEYSLGIEDVSTVTSVKSKFDSDWDNSGKLFIVDQNNSLETGIGQADPGDVVVVEPGIYEISSTLNIPEGITLVGLDATIVPAPNFSHEAGGGKLAKPALQTTPASLLQITGSNVTLMGLTLQDGPSYAIEVGDGSAALENIYISNTVFENNALGGIHVQGSSTYTIENNTFVGGDSGVTITVNTTASGIVRNNIFAEQTIAPVQIVSTDDGTVEYSYNLFYGCEENDCIANWHTGNLGTTSSAHDNLFDVDPLFVNPAIGNYRLYPNSPAIDAGDPAIHHEFLADGNSDDEFRIDIGAFEYGTVVNVAPVVTAGDDQTVELGNIVSVTAAYSDADNTEDHFARIDWGDGTVEDVPVNMTGPGAGQVTGEHTYSTAGNYTVEICVTDLYGAVGCDTMNVEVISSSSGSTEINIGETYVQASDDYGNGNLMVAQRAILSQDATIQSLSFYVTQAAGNLRLGVYDDDNENPGTLVARTDEFTPVVGWNTLSVQTPVLLPAGTYWLAYLPESNNLHFRVSPWTYYYSGRYYSYSYGEMPETFSPSPNGGYFQFSFYATFTVDAPAGTLYAGEVNILYQEYSGLDDTVVGQMVEITETAAIESLSVYINNAAGNLRLGIYDNGMNGPGTLLAQTDAFTPVAWNTQNVQTPVLLPAGIYWLAFLPEHPDLEFRFEWIPGQYTGRFDDQPYGELPFVYNQNPIGVEYRYSLYATLIKGDSSVFPNTGILDDFNRADGSIGSSWSGETSEFSIASNALTANSDISMIGWNEEAFDADQEAFVTLTNVDTGEGNVHGLILKSQSAGTPYNGAINVIYDGANERVQVYTFTPGQGWRLWGGNIPVTFVDGDMLGTRAKPDGWVEIYRNGALIGKRNVSAWEYSSSSGYIGLAFYHAWDAVVDDFGGESMMMSGMMSTMQANASEDNSEFVVTSTLMNLKPGVDTSFAKGLPSQIGPKPYILVPLNTSSEPYLTEIPDFGQSDEVAKVVFDVAAGKIQIWRYDAKAETWLHSGKDIPVKFVEGDSFTASINAKGLLEIQRNSELFTIIDVTP